MHRHTNMRQHVDERREDIVDFVIERRRTSIYTFGERRADENTT